MVEHLFIDADGRQVQLLYLLHDLLEEVVVDDQELALYRDKVEHQLVVDGSQLRVDTVVHLHTP